MLSTIRARPPWWCRSCSTSKSCLFHAEAVTSRSRGFDYMLTYNCTSRLTWDAKSTHGHGSKLRRRSIRWLYKYVNTYIYIYIYTYIYIYYNDKTQIVSWILTFNPSHTTGNPHPASPNPPALPAATDPSCPAPAPCPASPCSHPSHQPESWSCPRATKPWPGRNRDLLGLRWFFHVFPTNYSDVWWFMASVSDVSSSW